MSKSYKPWNPTQGYLLPPSPLEWLPDGHLAYFILELVSELDLSEIEGRIQGKDSRGHRPYAPHMLTSLLLYGYCTGVFSSRKLERATYEDVAFRVLASGAHPHFTTINQFRKDHLKALEGLFVQVLHLCQKVGMVNLGHVALDGTKVQANASKHKAMSYERMPKSERQLQEEIADLMLRADQVDSDEDGRYGQEQGQEDLPAELKHREKRLATIQKAMAELKEEATEARSRALRGQAAAAEERADTKTVPGDKKRELTNAQKRREKARELSDKDDDDLTRPRTGGGLPKHEPRVTPEGKPHRKAQMNFTDSDSRIMESQGTYVQGYNCQAAVDDANQVILAHGLSNLASDNYYLKPMLAKVVQNCGHSPAVLTADAGYWLPTVDEDCAALGTDAYVSTRRRKHGTEDIDSEPGGTLQQQAMESKLRTQKGRDIYRFRKAVVEPVFGQTKEGRGFRRFLLRGIVSAEAEWALQCTAHNILKLFRFQRLKMAC